MDIINNINNKISTSTCIISLLLSLELPQLVGRHLHVAHGHTHAEHLLQLELHLAAEVRDLGLEVVAGGHLGRHDLSDATCLTRPHLFSTALLV